MGWDNGGWKLHAENPDIDFVAPKSGALGWIDQPVEMLYNDISMLMGLVCTSMLFMVVPLISSLESMDDSLIEAAHDLGAHQT